MHVHDDAIYVHPEMMASWSDVQTKDKAYLGNSENVSHVQTSLLCFVPFFNSITMYIYMP